MAFLQNLFIFLFSLFVVSGCAKQIKSPATVTLKMPDQFQQQKAGGVQAMASNACFAVNIIANDIATTAGSECDQSFGTFGGLVSPGGTLALEVDQGNDRTVELYYILSDSGCQTFDIKSGLAKTFGANNVHRIAKMTGVDMNQSQMQLEIVMTLPNQSNSLATLFTTPASCDKDVAPLSPQGGKPARIVMGAGHGTTADGSRVHVRVLNQKLDMQIPINNSVRITPNRLGADQ